MIEFPDVSNWQGKTVMTGAQALIAKRSEGVGYVDPTYTWYHNQAIQLGIPFLGYHFLRRGNADAQADHAYGFDPRPLMLDVEVAGDGSYPTLADVAEFEARYTALGGRVVLAYIPHWFWQNQWGAPDLTGLTDAGIGLVSSNYTSTPDAGWQPYGGATPVIWQYTSSASWPGSTARFDMNRYQGTAEQLGALFEGDTMTAADVWTYPVTTLGVDDPTPVAAPYSQPAVEYLKWLPTLHNQLVQIADTLAKVVERLDQPAPVAGVPDHQHIPGGVADAAVPPA